eukprot:11024557-Ditylum_brightwellii.AAC.1
MTDNNYHQCLNAKPLHGKFFKQQEEIPQIDLDKLHQWLWHAHLHPETEATICAAQEQTMATNYIRKMLFKQNVNQICRLCCKANKTISHIVRGCKLLAGTNYTECHNKKHKSKQTTLITNQLLVTYDMTQDVENMVEANRPYIVVLDEKEKKAFIIDITIPMDINMMKAAA